MTTPEEMAGKRSGYKAGDVVRVRGIGPSVRIIGLLDTALVKDDRTGTLYDVELGRIEGLASPHVAWVELGTMRATSDSVPYVAGAPAGGFAYASTPKERQIERLSASMARDLIDVVKVAMGSSTPDTAALARLVAKVHVKAALLDLTKALPARLFR